MHEVGSQTAVIMSLVIDVNLSIPLHHRVKCGIRMEVNKRTSGTEALWSYHCSCDHFYPGRILCYSCIHKSHWCSHSSGYNDLC